MSLHRTRDFAKAHQHPSGETTSTTTTEVRCQVPLGYLLAMAFVFTGGTHPKLAPSDDSEIVSGSPAYNGHG